MRILFLSFAAFPSARIQLTPDMYKLEAILEAAPRLQPLATLLSLNVGGRVDQARP
jgi:hypothetical protein